MGRQGARPERPRLEARKAESREREWGSRGGGQPHHLGCLGSAVSSRSGIRGGSPAAKEFSRILNTQNDLSEQQDYGPRRFYFFASWPNGRARGRARTKMVGPRSALSIAIAATAWVGDRHKLTVHVHDLQHGRCGRITSDAWQQSLISSKCYDLHYKQQFETVNNVSSKCSNSTHHTTPNNMR